MRNVELINKYTKIHIRLSEERSKYRRLYHETEDKELKEKYKLLYEDLSTEAACTNVFLKDLKMSRGCVIR